MGRDKFELIDRLALSRGCDKLLVPGQAQCIHEPAILLWYKAIAFPPRPLKRTGLRTFVQRDKSIALQVQNLDYKSLPIKNLMFQIVYTSHMYYLLLYGSIVSYQATHHASANFDAYVCGS
jgi:hypothetical protein